MRFLKTLSLNRRAIYDDRLAVETDNAVVMRTPNNLLMPKGGNADRPTSPVVGMIRYNTDSNQVEVYQGVGGGATWRTLRFKEATQINRENYTGNGTKAVYGPLTYQPPSTVESGATWSGDNLIVIVGNVFQVNTTNYEIKLGENITPTVNDPGPFTTGQYYIQFTSASPGLSTPIVILHGFDQ